MNDTNRTPEYLEPSKTQRKLEMHALQDLGKTLTTLSTQKLQQLDLPEKLLEAIRDYQRITSHGALKRQLQYLGKLMREVDPAPIRQYLQVWAGDSEAHNAWLKRLERWREKLLAEDAALQQLLTEYPEADSQYFRTMIRNARKEQEAGKPPKQFRALYQALKQLIPDPGLAETMEEVEENDHE